MRVSNNLGNCKEFNSLCTIHVKKAELEYLKGDQGKTGSLAAIMQTI